MKVLLFLILSVIFMNSNDSNVGESEIKPKIAKEMIGTAIYCERKAIDSPCVEKIRE